MAIYLVSAYLVVDGKDEKEAEDAFYVAVGKKDRSLLIEFEEQASHKVKK